MNLIAYIGTQVLHSYPSFPARKDGLDKVSNKKLKFPTFRIIKN